MRNSSKSTLQNLLNITGIETRKKIYITILISVFAACLEALSVGSVFPIIFILNNENYTLNIAGENYLIGINQFVIGLLALLGLTTLFKILLFKRINELGHSISIEIASKIYSITLNMRLDEITSINSSKVIDFVLQKPELVVGYVKSYINIFTSVIISFAIVLLLIYKAPIFTFIAIILIGSFFISVLTLYRTKLKNDSLYIAENSSSLIKLIQESFNGIKEIIINNEAKFRADYLVDKYKKLHIAQKNIQFKSGLPRIIFEFYITVIVVILLIVVLNWNILSRIELLAFVALIALSMQRLLPLTNLVYGSWIEIKGHQNAIKDTCNFIFKYEKKTVLDSSNNISFSKEIQVRDVNFSYENQELIYNKNINFVIRKGQKILILGKSGSGKSTLINMLCGLIPPKTGKIIVDDIYSAEGPAWYRNISLVPQHLLLNDDSIKNNIILNNVYDESKYLKVIQMCLLEDLVSSKSGDESFSIGEFGRKISGGQKQRIGLARAMYRDSKILVLDEITSGINEELEAELLKNLLKMDHTLIFIAHNKKLVSEFDKTINLDEL